MKLFHFLMFIPYYLLMLVKSNWIVAKAVLNPRFDFDPPGIVAVDISIKSNIGILTMVNLITMTPGTLSLDLSEDRKKLYIHAMHVESREAFVSDINELENRLKKFLK
ncbi:Na+/H+ antiporter subunit E [Carboxylicivirga sp. A043]|uniref:Na+/H+ antiporter subunit E n=1 Tax=Carboxylicivirga litoralis TaxID=2816963 RepID=UPI0021CB5FD9|nr:Na+/H+ antiporter subunit E [Carboxylicivirga sp. A043]MCU4154412.1 Na+/H+ antiporter subunit E [Carboxylicivirga sp. A043]